MSRAAATALLREQTADPWRGWIRHAPARWPGPRQPWVDLAAGRLGASDGEPEVLAALHGPKLDDVLYLPPVPPELAAARDRLAAHHAARGTPVIAQVLPGDVLPVVSGESAVGIVVIRDLLPCVLGEDEVGAAVRPPADGVAVTAAILPLLPGGGDPARWEALAGSLAAEGIAVLQPSPIELGPRERRDLGATMSESRYLRLFHGDPPSALEISRIAVRHGLQPLLSRPLPRPPLRGAGMLRVAGALALCGELCLLLGESESRAQALLRAARLVEREGIDLVALAREGNLAVVPWLEGEASGVVADIAADRAPRLQAELTTRLRAS